MKAPTFAPVYVSLFPRLSEIAQKHGYALAAHGSFQTDCDLVAVPWIEQASDAETLMRDIGEYLQIFSDTFSLSLHGPEDKPHGRRAWLLATGFGSGIDLSIVPRITS